MELYCGGMPVIRQRGRDLWDGARLREIRERRGLNQDELAAKAGSSKSEIGRHESNKPTSNPTIEVLGRYAIALDVALVNLVEPVGSPIPRPGDGTGHEARPETGSSVLDRAVQQAKAAPGTWQADVADAVAALARALGRRRDSGQGPTGTDDAGR
jgi:transcriptional regulator with XRE-family HTH domain